MDVKGRKLGGRAYLISELGKHGLSRRRAVRILNDVFREMGLALRCGEYVEFPFGYLKAEKRVSQRWEAIGDEPMRPWWIEHVLDDAGERILDGEELSAPKPGWSRKPDKKSLIYRWDQALKRERGSAGARRETGKQLAPKW
jgi:hypothetical protein